MNDQPRNDEVMNNFTNDDAWSATAGSGDARTNDIDEKSAATAETSDQSVRNIVITNLTKDECKIDEWKKTIRKKKFKKSSLLNAQ